MAAYLITGTSGTGKSTICRELQERGYQAFDGDAVKGLCGWVDEKTGLPARPSSMTKADLENLAWSWDSTVLSDLILATPELFLCGSSNNQLDFHHLFTKVFVLTIDPEAQLQRILARTEHDYGKDPAMHYAIINAQKEFVTKALVLGAVPVNAMQRVS